MTLLELADACLLPGSPAIEVRLPDGSRAGEILPGDEPSLFALSRYLPWEVAAQSPAGPGLTVASVRPPKRPEGPKAPPLGMCPDDVGDEAAWSADWRAREPRPTPAQLSMIYRAGPALYAAIASPGWPRDPAQLTRREAGDAIERIKRTRRASEREEGGDRDSRPEGLR